MRYAIRRISPLGALLYGLLLGLVGWLVPGALLGWLARAAVLRAREWLAGFQLTLPLPFAEDVVLDLTSALPLAEAQARVGALAAQEWALVLAVALGTAAAGMLLTGLAAVLGALFYNLFAAVLGGVEVTLNGLDAVPATPQKAAPPPPRPVAVRPPMTAPAVSAWLAAGNGGERLTLRGDVTRIGSAPDNDVVLPGLAPQHAEIRRESGRFLIYDLGSRRTWVNDTQVAAVHMLKDGFRLQLGQTEYTVHILMNQSPAEE
jgi:hypothetical protein